MAGTPSLFAGIGAQFFDNAGNILTGGKIYSYESGTTTPIATYTTEVANVAHPNPIILDASGRVPSGGEIWLKEGDTTNYKFVLKTTTDVLIATYDNVPGTYSSANLGNTTDPALGDALVGFRQSNAAGNLTGAIGRTVHQKFQETVSVKDFGAVGDGVTDDTTAINNALLAGAGNAVYLPEGNYLISGTLSVKPGTNFYGEGACDVLVPGTTGSTIYITQTATKGVTLGRGATLEGMNFWYPNQVTTTSPVVYEYTIASDISDPFQNGNNGGITIKNLVIHNAYNGILFDGDFTDGSPNTGAVMVSQVRIYAINIGMNMVTTSSEVNISDCVWSPLFWNASAGQPIRAWAINNGVACWLQQSAQGPQMSNCTMFGHARGIYLYNPSVPSLVRAQCNFLKVTGCLFDGLRRCVEVTDKFGFGGANFTGCQFLARNEYDNTVNDCIGFYSNNSSNINYVLFNSCEFLGTAGSHVVINNDPTTTAFSWYQFVGSLFTSANANNQAGTYYNIFASDKNGSLQVSGCQFQNTYPANVTKVYVPILSGLMVTDCDIYDSTGTPFNVITVSSRLKIADNTVRNFLAGTWPTTVTNIATVPSAATVTLGESDIGLYKITGTTNITSVTASWWGRTVMLKFDGVLTVTDGSNLKLNGDFTTTADDTLTLTCDGTNWYEIARSAN